METNGYVVDPAAALLEEELNDIEYVAVAEGHKSSEGDGRTAADIDRELGREVPS